MKATIQEYDHCFMFNFDPETIEDAAVLVRMGMNITKRTLWSETTVSKKGVILNRTAIGSRKVKKDLLSTQN